MIIVINHQLIVKMVFPDLSKNTDHGSAVDGFFLRNINIISKLIISPKFSDYWRCTNRFCVSPTFKRKFVKISGHTNSKLGILYHHTKERITRKLVASQLKIDCLKETFFDGEK